MSREELIAAYLDRRMSRRALARRLAAGGMSAGLAIAYAQALDPSEAAARLFGNVHFDASIKIIDEDLDKAVDKKGLKVRLKTDRAMTMHADVYLLRSPNVTPFTRSWVGRAVYEFPGAGSLTKRIRFKLNPPHSQTAVKVERNERGKARFEVLAGGFAQGVGARDFFVQRTLTT